MFLQTAVPCFGAIFDTLSFAFGSTDTNDQQQSLYRSLSVSPWRVCWVCSLVQVHSQKRGLQVGRWAAAWARFIRLRWRWLSLLRRYLRFGPGIRLLCYFQNVRASRFTASAGLWQPSGAEEVLSDKPGKLAVGAGRNCGIVCDSKRRRWTFMLKSCPPGLFVGYCWRWPHDPRGWVKFGRGRIRKLVGANVGHFLEIGDKTYDRFW